METTDMGKPTPTLGYPSRTQAALALKAEGLRTAAIAERMGVSENAVTGLLAGAGKPEGHYPSESYRAEMQGIMLSHEAGTVQRRPTSDGACREVLLRIPEHQYARLISAALKVRATPGAFALDLFQRGWTAEANVLGAVPDGEAAGADQQDELRAEIARLRGRLAESKARIAALEAEATAAGEDAAISVDPETAADAARWKKEAESLERQLAIRSGELDKADAETARLEARIAELEEAMKGAAVAANHAGALLRERDDRIALLEEAQADKVRGNRLLHDRALAFEKSVLDRDDRIAALEAELAAAEHRRTEMAAKIDRQSASLAELEARVEAVALPQRWVDLPRHMEAVIARIQAAGAPTEPDVPEPRPIAPCGLPAHLSDPPSLKLVPIENVEIVPPALTPAQLRMATAMRAAGNSRAEIAAELGVPVALVPTDRKGKR
jgi:hypothetical protein